MAATLSGAFLLAAAIFVNLLHTHLFSTSPYLLFRVDWNVLVGYSLLNPAVLVDKLSFLMGCQYMGFALMVGGLVLAIRRSSGWSVGTSPETK